MSYGSYESVHAADLEDGREVEFQLTMDCTSRGCAAQLYGLPENCYPAEAAEFELASVHVLDEEGKPVKISEPILAAFLGTVRADAMIEVAAMDAIESGEF